MLMKPTSVWVEGTEDNSIPANANGIRLEVLVSTVISKTTTAQPGSPASGDVYIIPTGRTGAVWTTFAINSIAIFKSGTWYEVVPQNGLTINVNGTLEVFTTVWAAVTILSTPAPPNVQAVTSAATVTPTFSNDMVRVTAQAVGLTLANPSGTAVDAWGWVLRIKDNGTARTIAYGTQYRAADGVTLPTTTVVGKTHYITGIWNVQDTKVDVLSVGTMP